MNPHILPLEFTGGDNWLVATTAIGHYIIKRIVTDEAPIWHCGLYSKLNLRQIDNYMCGFTPEEAKQICQREHETTIYTLLTESGRALLNIQPSTT